MAKALVCLNADLPSSIALRYACRLKGQADLGLHTIHVEEPEKNGFPPGTGWVRRTWESGLLEEARRRISQLVIAEKETCQELEGPRILIGDHDRELLRELRSGSYDLFIEGMLHSAKPSNFIRKIRSRLYRNAACPILLVKNLVLPEKIMVLMGLGCRPDLISSTLLNIFTRYHGTVDINIFDVKKRSDARLEPLPAGSDARVEKIVKTLEGAEWKIGKTGIITGEPSRSEKLFDDYGLVAAHLPPDIDKNSPLLVFLAMVPSAVLLCR